MTMKTMLTNDNFRRKAIECIAKNLIRDISFEQWHEVANTPHPLRNYADVCLRADIASRILKYDLPYTEADFDFVREYVASEVNQRLAAIRELPPVPVWTGCGHSNRPIELGGIIHVVRNGELVALDVGTKRGRLPVGVGKVFIGEFPIDKNGRVQRP